MILHDEHDWMCLRDPPMPKLASIGFDTREKREGSLLAPLRLSGGRVALMLRLRCWRLGDGLVGIGVLAIWGFSVVCSNMLRVLQARMSRGITITSKRTFVLEYLNIGRTVGIRERKE